MFKQFITSGAMQYCQIDSCRMAGVNEVLAVILMAAKYGVPVCPHAGGVGLCEYVQHFSIWDYVAVTGTRDNRMIEYVPHLVEHFQHPARCLNGHYMVPEHAGYGCHIKQESIEMYEYPNGTYWKQEQQQHHFQHYRKKFFAFFLSLLRNSTWKFYTMMMMMIKDS